MTCTYPANRVIHRVKGDGACMFRALVHAYADDHNNDSNSENIEAKYMRQLAVDYLKSHKARYNANWKNSIAYETGQTLSHEAYVRYMSRESTYGTQLELAIVSYLLHRKICVLSQRPDGTITGLIVDPVHPLQGTNPTPLYLWLSNPGEPFAHYDAVVRRRTSTPERSSVSLSSRSADSTRSADSMNQNRAVASILAGMKNQSPEHQINMMRNVLASGGLSQTNRSKVMAQMARAQEMYARASAKRTAQSRATRVIEDLMPFSRHTQVRALRDMLTHSDVKQNGTSRAFIRTRLQQLGA